MASVEHTKCLNNRESAGKSGEVRSSSGGSWVTPQEKGKMAETLHAAGVGVVTEQTCGICLADSKDPRDLPCGHSFCAGCLDEWRSRYGVKEEMRRKCPICRARIPPSKEMVAALLHYRAIKQRMENHNDASLEEYHCLCRLLEDAETEVGPDWDGVTILEDNRKPPVAMPDYIVRALSKGDIRSVLRWINDNRSEDRANSVSSARFGMSALMYASTDNHLTLSTLLLQLGADVNTRDPEGLTPISMMFDHQTLTEGSRAIDGARLLLGWGANFFPGKRGSRETCVSLARKSGKHELASLLESELGGRRCEIVNFLSRPELNGKTCVAHEYLPDSNQYKVTLETKSKQVLVLGPDNLKRRDRTPQDCGYYTEYKNGRIIRHDFDSSEECQAFVAALNNDKAQPVVTEEAEAAAEQAAAELLAELGLDDSQAKVSTGSDHAKRSKKKKGGKKKKRK